MIYEIDRKLATFNGYSEASFCKVLQNIGIRPENMLGLDLAAELKRMSDDNAVVSGLGRRRGYKVKSDYNSKSSPKNKGQVRQSREEYNCLTAQKELYDSKE